MLSKTEIAEYYKKALGLEPQLLISYLVKEIKLYNDCIEIIYNTSIKINPDESRGFSFYTEKTKIAIYDTTTWRYSKKT